jgi:hypothetical protein
MPKPQQPPQPKRPSRVWLYGPYVAVIVALLAWSGVWLAERAKVQGELNGEAQHLRADGYQVAWSGLTIDGWPFRLHVTLQQPHVSDATGWAFDAPRLEAVGLAYTPSNWVLVAPAGLTLTRPDKGPAGRVRQGDPRQHRRPGLSRAALLVPGRRHDLRRRARGPARAASRSRQA